jgi:hypothetical protein
MAGFPEAGDNDESAMTAKACRPVSLSSFLLHNKGPGRKKISGKFLFSSVTAGRLSYSITLLQPRLKVKNIHG